MKDNLTTKSEYLYTLKPYLLIRKSNMYINFCDLTNQNKNKKINWIEQQNKEWINKILYNYIPFW